MVGVLAVHPHIGMAKSERSRGPAPITQGCQTRNPEAVGKLCLGEPQSHIVVLRIQPGTLARVSCDRSRDAKVFRVARIRLG